jgi:geranylgeranylglycerol-phosphate geranylgeranyltransferase
MTRPSSVVTGLLAIPGWLAAKAPPPTDRLVAVVGALMLARLVVNLVNDIVDREKDRVTAPEFPLPSGLVTVSQAVAAVIVLMGCLVGLLGIASGTWLRFSLGAGTIALGFVLAVVYSLVKRYAFLSLAVTAGVYLCVPLTAWLIAGAGWSTEILIVFGYAILRGVSANIFSTLRDIELDGAVGNRSIAMRLGSARALALAFSIEVVVAFCVLGVALTRHRAALGLLVVAVVLSLLAVGYITTCRRQEVASTRTDRAIAAVPMNIVRHFVPIALVQSLPVGLVAILVRALAAPIDIFPLYERRVIDGALRRSLLLAGGSPPNPDPHMANDAALHADVALLPGEDR